MVYREPIHLSALRQMDRFFPLLRMRRSQLFFIQNGKANGSSRVLGTGAAALAAVSTGLGVLEGKASAASKTADHLLGYNSNRVSGHFDVISPSNEDQLIIPKGYKYDVVAAFDDVINSANVLNTTVR